MEFKDLHAAVKALKSKAAKITLEPVPILSDCLPSAKTQKESRMSHILKDTIKAAEWISQGLRTAGYRADFSPESLWYIDFFFDDHSRNGKPVSGGLLAEDLGKRLFVLGAYVGEVLRRNLGGEWHGDDTDPHAEINIKLKLTSGAHCWPVQRVMKRFKNGAEDNIAAYGVGMGLQIGTQPERAEPPHGLSSKKPWWKFWYERVHHTLAPSVEKKIAGLGYHV